MSTSTLPLIDVACSTRFRCKPSRSALHVSLALGALHLVAACTDEKKDGGLAVVVESDLQLPKDFDGLRFEVSQDGRTIQSENFPVGAGDSALLVPAEFRVKPLGDTKRPVLIRALAIKGTTIRIERSVITTVPSDYLAFVRLPLTYLCTGMAREDGGSTCGDAQTCKLGACEPAEIDPKTLPVYVTGPWSSAGLDGAHDASQNACFDVVNCLAEASRVTLDRDACTFRIEDEDPANISVGIKLPRGSDGICGAAGCWIALEEGAEGWTHEGSLVMLPRALCLDAADGTRLTIVVSNTCVAKTLYTPPCGDWSSATKPADSSESIGITASSMLENPGDPVGVSCAGLSFQECGDCGQQRRTCRNGTWSDWGECSGQGLCTPNSSESCGTNGMRTCLSTCDWDDCSGQTCVGAAVEACGNCGTRRRACDNGQWAPWGACEDAGECMPGTTQACGTDGTQACMGNCQWGVCGMQACEGAPQQACGNCGTQSRECAASTTTWSAFGVCAEEGACEANQTRSCGLGGMQTCGGDCQWDGACTGQVCEGPASQPCARCGIQTRTCDDTSGLWSDWSACSNQGTCDPESSQSCGAGGRQLCLDSCQWSEECTDQECLGAMTQSCGFCGTQSHECNELTGDWSDWAACTNQGPCNPGATRRCGSNGTQACTASCQWSPMCSGQTCPGSNTEPCGNCGTQMLTCNGNTGQWVRTGGCLRQGTCTPGSFESCGANKLHQCSDTCSYGDCNICAQGARECDNACVDVQTDPFNCGGCGNSCNGLACSAGNCATCPSGQHNCSGDCRLNTDPASCGGSCTPCPAPANGTPTCTASRCDWQCNPGYHRCGDSFQCFSNNAPGFCGDRCNVDCSPPSGGRAACENASCVAYCGELRVDVRTDANNCGACGTRCASGAPCVDGMCQDIDECAREIDNCSPNATCTDTAASFSCECNPGFSGDGVQCTDINECASGNGGCSADATCANTTGSRTCTCKPGFVGNGITCTTQAVNECTNGTHNCSSNATCTDTAASFSCACNAGFNGDGVQCTDINECASDNGGCSADATCANTAGSRTCTCKPGFVGNGITCTTQAVNECTNGTHNCSSNATCTDTAASFSCACNAGFNGDGVQCTDINECASDNGGCSADATCANTAGSRTCTCKPGFVGNGITCTTQAVNECTNGTHNCSSNATCTDTAASFSCACNAGFNGDGVQCTDINECASDNGGCSADATCANTAGSRTCTCKPGFVGNGITCTTQAVNECTNGTHNCSSNATCTDTAASFSCACNAGFNGDGVECTDINECASDNGGCSADATCANTAGSRTCTCKPGFVGDGITCTAQAVNECTNGTHNCSSNATCTDTAASFSCACNAGFSGDGVQCTDINECASGNGGCSADATCANTAGSRTCTCKPGFVGDGITCTTQAVNECTNGTHNCSPNATCTDTRESFTCSCNDGYEGDGVKCTSTLVDPCKPNPCEANEECSSSGASNEPTCTCPSPGFRSDIEAGCQDIDECADKTHDCDLNATCTNTTGAFTCTCNQGYSGNGRTCTLDSRDAG